jgi:hypothetical protein
MGLLKTQARAKEIITPHPHKQVLNFLVMLLHYLLDAIIATTKAPFEVGRLLVTVFTCLQSFCLILLDSQRELFSHH